MSQDIIQLLGAPFPFEEVEAKIQVNSGDKKSGLAVFYLDSRAIQNRLDKAVGALNWSNSFSTWQENAQICGISIYNQSIGEWVTKHDGADNSKIEAIKGGLTDAFKRAAVLWGIGRYLYQIDGVWVEIEQRGNSSIIKENQKGKLKATYDAAVKKIFGNTATQPTSTSTVSVADRAVGTLATNHESENNQQPQQKPAQQSVSSAQTPATSQSPPPQDASNTLSTTNPQNPTEQPPQSNVVSVYDYKIHSVKPAGGGSHQLELHDRNGKVTTAYAKPEETGIAVGKHLKNVKLEAKTSQYGNYNLLTSFEVAA